MRIALVYNPGMAQARLKRIAALARVLAARGHSLTHHDSKSFRADEEACDLVCICGGDGTVQLVIASQPDPAALPGLAIYPVGTINLLAREMGYQADSAAFARRIESANAPLVSRLALANGRPLLCCLSVGADAHAVAALSEPLKARIGRMAYAAAMAQVLAGWTRQAMTIETDAGTFTGEALFVLRGAFYAGPWKLAPQAALDNERLQLLILPRARRRDILQLIIRTLTGTLSAAKGWPVIAAEWLNVQSSDALPVQIDGDSAGTTPLAIAMSEARVRFV